MAVERLPKPARAFGSVSPRIGPPVPVRSRIAEYEAAAADLHLDLLPWQRVAARYITAIKGRGKGETWRYTEVAIVVARQNGKTRLLAPRILMGLANGESILHTAQNREIPRKSFLELAGIVAAHPELDYGIRKGNGQEEIWTPQGGRYKIVAANSGSRGESADLVLIDEVREQRDQELMDAILPTIMARPRAQTIYLSNAGDAGSVVLNDLRIRGTERSEPRLAYLEWSSPADLDIDDRAGWAQANPGLGHIIDMDKLEYFYRKGRASRQIASFETENLCRWVDSMMPPVLSDAAWQSARADLPQPVRPKMAVAVDPASRRVSAAIAWKGEGDVVNVHLAADHVGDPIDIDAVALGVDGEPGILEVARGYGIRAGIGYDPLVDKDILRHLKDAVPVSGHEYERACERFVSTVEGGRLRHSGVPELDDDIGFTVRLDKPYGWIAARASDERATTASFAAIRAVWLATSPAARPPQVY